MRLAARPLSSRSAVIDTTTWRDNVAGALSLTAFCFLCANAGSAAIALLALALMTTDAAAAGRALLDWLVAA
jgi:hypothetical protein